MPPVCGENDSIYSEKRRRAHSGCKGYGALRNAVFAEGSMRHHPPEVAFASRLEATYVYTPRDIVCLAVSTHVQTEWIRHVESGFEVTSNRDSRYAVLA
jgi:hypothetical protein